jgi:hypothetical protein
MKTALVSWLLRLYPKAWRKEYGAELGDMLRARPLTARVCSDVVRSALWQRARAIHAPSWVGLGLMLVTTSAIAWNIVDAPAYGFFWDRPTIPERIELLQRPLDSELYVLVLAGIGFWTAMRRTGSSGWAAIQVSTIASIPLLVVGVLMLFGVLDFVELHPGQMPTTFQERGIVYTFYHVRQEVPVPAPIVLLLSPLLRVPGAWLWGVIGGWLGRRYADWRRRPVSA